MALPTPEQSHRERAVAESFGKDTARYDRTRPDYPDAMVARVTSSIPGTDVLDVGIGTGIAARKFAAAGCAVHGVDPDPRMVEFTRRAGFDVDTATFEDWEAAGRTFDAVVSGQAWHWVDPVAGARKAAELLRPGGRVAAFWNAGETPVALMRAFADLYDRIAPESIAGRGSKSRAVDLYSSLAAQAVGGMDRAHRLGEPEAWRYEWRRTYTRDQWLDLVPTTYDHPTFAPDQLDELLAGMRRAIDDAGGEFTMRYTTLVATARVNS